MKKKVLIFSLFYYPNPVSGAEVAIKEITDRLKGGDIEFHMVTLRGTSNIPDHEQIDNILVHRMYYGVNDSPKLEDFDKRPFKYNKYFYQVMAGLRACKLHRQYHYDAIWVLMAHSSGVPAAIFNLINPKVPILLTLQEGDPISQIESSVRPLFFLFKRIFIKAKIVQAISSYLGDWARSRGFTGQLEIIYNGANENDFKDKFDETLMSKVSTSINKKEGEVILVTTSRLEKKNAIDDVISAMKYLPDNVRFIVCGGGVDKDKLDKQIVDLGLGNRVKLVGQVDRSETSIYRRLSDIFVRPSRSEGLGNSFAGAMASKIPVIATQEGGIREFLFDKIRNPGMPATGFAVDKDSPQQIADKVMYIINNKDEVMATVDNAYRLVVEKYRWDNIARDMKDKVFGNLFRK
jgi:glycosyltransferase involved in cell wall biosynthesis